MGRKKLSELDKVPMRNLNIKFNESDAEKLTKYAEEFGISISALIRMIVLSKLKKFEVSSDIKDLFD